MLAVDDRGDVVAGSGDGLGIAWVRLSWSDDPDGASPGQRDSRALIAG